MGYGTGKCINVPIENTVIELVSISKKFYNIIFDLEVDIKVT